MASYAMGAPTTKVSGAGRLFLYVASLVFIVLGYMAYGRAQHHKMFRVRSGLQFVAFYMALYGFGAGPISGFERILLYTPAIVFIVLGSAPHVREMFKSRAQPEQRSKELLPKNDVSQHDGP